MVTLLSAMTQVRASTPIAFVSRKVLPAGMLAAALLCGMLSKSHSHQSKSQHVDRRSASQQQVILHVKDTLATVACARLLVMGYSVRYKIAFSLDAPATNVVADASRPIAPPCVVMFVSQSVVGDAGRKATSASTFCVLENARRYRLENQTLAGDGLDTNVKCASSASSRHWPGLRGSSGGSRRIPNKLCDGAEQLPYRHTCD